MTRTATLPRLSGIFVAVGGPAYLFGGGICTARLTSRLGGRCSGQRKPWGRDGLARLLALAPDEHIRLTSLNKPPT